MKIAPIPGYYGLYVATDDGRIIGEKTGKTLKMARNKGGYLRVKLYKNAQPRMYMVHRLVASTFLPNPLGKEQVNHKDGDKGNNQAINLEWVTQSENQIHAYKNGLNTTVPAVNANKKLVVQGTMTGEKIRTWNSMSEASRATGIPVSNISHCCKGRIKHAGGYKWNFV